MRNRVRIGVTVRVRVSRYQCYGEGASSGCPSGFAVTQVRVRVRVKN